MDYDAYDALLHHIFKQTQGDAWFKPAEETISTGVCLRVEPGVYRVFPYENPDLEPFETAIRALSPEVAVKVRSAAVHTAFTVMGPEDRSLQVDPTIRIQVLETMLDLGSAEKEQKAAFIRDERVMIVWSDSVDNIVASTLDLESRLLKLVWKSRNGATNTTSLTPLSGTSAFASTPSRMSLSATRKNTIMTGTDIELTEKAASMADNHDVISLKEKELEAGAKPAPRPTRTFAAIYIGIAVALSTFFVGSGVKIILMEWALDNDFIRFALLATVPLVFCIALFFSIQIVNTVSVVIGPIAQVYQNSKYFSAIPPVAPPKGVPERLPHVTIQMPVYKESLEQTIAPSIESIKKAMQTYARQGGTSSIFINDDGLQLLSEEDRELRMQFYAKQDIGFVARPPHGQNGFLRAGRFKKASNMNYGLALSMRAEEILLQLQAQEATKNPFGADVDGQEEEMDIEERALQMAIDETNGEAWAKGARHLRIGEIILIVDSDTQVPEDCFRDAARELAESPNVAIIQHASDVMQVAHHYFENAITYFTRRINQCISIDCANGNVAPFVGHNAFLRWSAVQEAAFIDPADGKKKMWSESNVSEDFDMALRLMMCGYIVRWATYSKGGFKEGVSLTADDELNRWQKYAYGCSELIFNPLYQWVYKGPINAQLRKFVWSDAPLHYKISMMSYMFSYYGIAAAFTLSFLNYIILGWELPVDGYYLHAFEIWLSCTVVFSGAGTISMTVVEYRLGLRSLFNAFWVNIKWIPFFFFFFGGLSLHLSGAVLAHLFSYNMTWAATKKEVEFSNFFKEVPKIFKRFWLSILISFLTIAMIIVLALPIMPRQWAIGGAGWAVIFPLAIQAGCHILYPIVLNPWLLLFTY
ncbi:hypothetical protein PIIN_02390 [Serendipita indica DSM 11827]|uniref:Uncharacterized protein n=1 Tax=Serendipita indica (strain DSM 11827) TaxID=1109443 RepID=G4TB17_SERID|nr:hypothetical protein PIIN_02390 [Serendipita indica DSM 11827]